MSQQHQQRQEGRELRADLRRLTRLRHPEALLTEAVLLRRAERLGREARS